MEEWIQVNVGGKIFSSTKETLLLIPYFQSKNRFNPLNSCTEIKIDQDPSVFKHILRSMRNPGYEIPDKYSACLDFWGLPELKPYTSVAPKFDVESSCKTEFNISGVVKTKTEFWKNFDIVLQTGKKKTIQLDHEVDMDNIRFIFPKNNQSISQLRVEFLNQSGERIFKSRVSESIWSSHITLNSACRELHLNFEISEIFENKHSVKAINFELLPKTSKSSKEEESVSFKGRIFYKLSHEPKFTPRRLLITPSLGKFYVRDGKSDLWTNIQSVRQSNLTFSNFVLCFVSKKILKSFSCYDRYNKLLFCIDLKYHIHRPPLKLEFSFVKELENSRFEIEPKIDLHYYLIVYYGRQ